MALKSLQKEIEIKDKNDESKSSGSSIEWNLVNSTTSGPVTIRQLSIHEYLSKFLVIGCPFLASCN